MMTCCVLMVGVLITFFHFLGGWGEMFRCFWLGSFHGHPGMILLEVPKTKFEKVISLPCMGLLPAPISCKKIMESYFHRRF